MLNSLRAAVVCALVLASSTAIACSCIGQDDLVTDLRDSKESADLIFRRTVERITFGRFATLRVDEVLKGDPGPRESLWIGGPCSFPATSVPAAISSMPTPGLHCWAREGNTETKFVCAPVSDVLAPPAEVPDPWARAN